MSRSPHRLVLLITSVVAIVGLAACTAPTSPAPATVTVTAPAAAGVAGTGSGGTGATGTNSGGTTTTTPTGTGSAALLQEVLAARTALTQHLTAGDFIAAERAEDVFDDATDRLDRAADWYGADADLTEGDLAVSASTAVTTAVAAAGQGTVRRIELDADDSALRWEIDVQTSAGERDVTVDATTGQVVEIDD